MKLSHVLYKVNDLAESVAQFIDRGFHVEYGSKQNPSQCLNLFFTWALH